MDRPSPRVSKKNRGAYTGARIRVFALNCVVVGRGVDPRTYRFSGGRSWASDPLFQGVFDWDWVVYPTTRARWEVGIAHLQKEISEKHPNLLDTFQTFARSMS